MTPKTPQMIAVLGALAVGFLFVKLMYDMTGAMDEMTGHVGAISKDVAEMRASMQQMTGNMMRMSDSVERMEVSMRGMGRAFQQGSDQLQQWNPGEMMKQMVPAQQPRTR